MGYDFGRGHGRANNLKKSVGAMQLAQKISASKPKDGKFKKAKGSS
jgi:hypothetical protein